MDLLYPLIAGFVIMLVSLSGVLTTWSTVGEWMKRHLHFLISFAAGVFFIVAFGLLQEVFEITSTLNAILYIALGFLAFVLFEKLFPESHHHHEQSCEHPPKKISSKKILTADAIHNFADGLLIVPAFLASVEIGIAVSIGILVHEFVQEVSEFFVLKEAGLTTKQALIRNFGVSSSVILGIVLSFILIDVEGIEPILLGIAGGGFLYVVFVDLIPHSLGSCTSKKGYAQHILWGVIGALIMLGVNSLFAEAHLHGGDDHDDHSQEEHDFDEHAEEL